MKDVFSIAVPSGRMSEETIDYLKSAGFAEFQLPESRELSFYDRTGKFRVLLVRNQDVPVCVLHGGAQAGVTGIDVLKENQYDLTVPGVFTFGKCRLSLACKEEDASDLLSRSHLKVATKYPHLTQDWFFRTGRSCEIVKLHGSVEVAPILGLADCIVDLVSTGSTLRANGLVEIESILESSAALVVNRASYATHTDTVRSLIQAIRKNGS